MFCPFEIPKVQQEPYPEVDFLDEILTKVFLFPLCYSHSPLQLCYEISISSNYAISYSF